MAISHFQTLLNEIISSDTINSANLAVHEESYEDIIEEAKSLARKICPHDAKAGNLMLIACLWARDRNGYNQNPEKQDIEEYIRRLISNPGKTINP